MLLSYLYRSSRGWAIVALSLLATPAAAQTPRMRDNSPVAALQRWTARIDAHRPGENDAAVAAQAALKPDERAVLLNAAIPFAVYFQRGNDLSGPPGVKLNPIEKTLVSNLANEIASKQTFAAWLRRAVVLETDVAVLAPEITAEAMRGAPNTGIQESIRAEDGETGERGLLDWHWDLARYLLDQRDRPGSDAFAADWYHAVALYQLDHMLLAELTPHLRKAALVFPADARIKFDQGCLADALGSGRVQAVLVGEQPRGFRPSVPTQEAAESQAAGHFRRAMELDAKAAEPRVRLARLLEKSGKAKDAVDLLAQASSLPKTRELEYMSHLVAARAKGALGEFEDAALHLKAALQLFPTAQSPLVALSQLALEAGELEDAVAAASNLRLDPRRGDRDDPWWSYFQAAWLRNGKLLDDLRAQVRR